MAAATTGWASPRPRSRPLSRYLARDLGAKGIRSNLISAGPIKTMAAKSIPGFDQFDGVWDDRAPLGWDLTDAEPAARGVVALLSDWFPKTTGEIIHVDGGLHAIAVDAVALLRSESAARWGTRQPPVLQEDGPRTVVRARPALWFFRQSPRPLRKSLAYSSGVVLETELQVGDA